MSNLGFTDEAVLQNWTRLHTSVGPGPASSVAADTQPVASLRGATYIITLWNDAEAVVKQFHVDVAARSGDLNYSVSTKLGDSVAAHATVALQGSDMVLTVTNDEAFSLEVELNRLILGT